MQVLIYVALFLFTALLDWLAGKWQDAQSRVGRANYSAVYEIVACTSFLALIETRSLFSVVSCVAGAWVGSYLAGERPQGADNARTNDRRHLEAREDGP